jgi:hypothetical protein
MSNHPFDAFRRAMQIGQPALLRLRAEIILDHGNQERIPLTATQREQLERIAVAPCEGDEAFLRDFDRYFEEWESEDDDR